ncbi:CENP-S associating centromere protein X-domain-containing protein [Dipodascopsis uninucleata]
MAFDNPDEEPFDEEKTQEVITFSIKTLARLMAEYFEYPDTRISATAIDASTEYLRIFTREAVWRTEKTLKETEKQNNNIKSESGIPSSSSSSTRARTMEARDLEKIAGTLVLDF